MITYKLYTEELNQLEIEDGFFNGWPNPPSKQTHREILEKSYKSLVAIDEEKNKIIGFINVISDGILSTYIPLLEVVPRYQNQGIGSELVKRMLVELKDFYMIDLCCDKNLQSFYEKLGMIKTYGMIFRNFQNQCGREIYNREE